MSKSSNTERAKRVNMAIALLKKSGSISEAATALSTQYGISKRQAYRYVKEAEVAGKQVAVPARKIAFTVKVSENLTQELRQYARFKDQTLSEVVTEALMALLHKGWRRGQNEGNGKIR
jgi:molybdenum-dependent DNA-binding transcriptional regulator ModE